MAAVFAWASHMHGTYVKQLAEIIHPSMEYRNVLGRKIATGHFDRFAHCCAFYGCMASIRRYCDQLGISPNATPGTFGEPSSSMIWSRLGPTIVLNILIWGLGTLYAWAMNEKVPGLREILS